MWGFVVPSVRVVEATFAVDAAVDPEEFIDALIELGISHAATLEYAAAVTEDE